MNADRNLLLIILAFQNNFIDRQGLLRALHQWITRKSRSIGDVLVEQGQLDTSQHQLLDALVAEYLKQHGGDAEQSLVAVSSVGSLRDDVRRLADPELNATLEHVAADKRGDQPPSIPAPTCAEASGSVGTRFRILRPHARGGLGEVYVAEDAELHREVALKEIQRRHADDPSSRTRFVLEAEITGGLEHPGIVPVYGLGSYADGRPFYAMRFIRGDSLKEAAERFHKANRSVRDPGQRSLELRKLLGRFVDVCNAIEYAHSRGVLHRDLKPGNIMLGKYGETLVVDWGLAKVVGRDELRTETEERALRPISSSGLAPTQFGSAVGTPQYMSPEQAEGRLDELGPASDVYSLGATLYTLLTGRVPFQDDDLAAVLRHVRQGDFPAPRQVDRNVPRALEAICLKAMALQPARRYTSPRQLSDDVENWLADERVSALAETAVERLARWGRKHRDWVRAGAAALLVVAVVSAVSLVVVEHARRDVAEALVAETKAKRDAELSRQEALAFAEAERLAKQIAQKRLEQIEKGNNLLGTIFADLHPDEAENQGRPLPAVLGERLDLATDQLRGEAIGDPLTVARLQLTLARSQLGLGFPVKAVDLAAQARETFTALLGPEDPETVTTMNDLAWAYKEAGQLDNALPLLEETLKLRQQLLGPDDPGTLRTMNNLAAVYHASGKLEKALPLYEQALVRLTAAPQPDQSDKLRFMNNLALAYKDAAKFDRALPLLEEALQRQKVAWGPEHLGTLRTMNSLAVGYQDAGNPEKALPLLEESLKSFREKLDAGHPETLISMHNLAGAYLAAGKLDQALPLYEEVMKGWEASTGPDDPRILTTVNNLATAYQAAGKLDQSLTLFEQAFKLRKAKLGPDHPDVLSSVNNLALAYKDVGKPDKAIAMFEESLKLHSAKLGSEHPNTLAIMINLASAYRAVGKPEQAVPLFEQALAVLKRTMGTGFPMTQTCMNNLALAYQAARELDKALPLFEETFELSKAKLGAEHPNTLATMSNLAMAHQAVGNLEQALPLLEKAVELSKAKLGTKHPITLRTMNNLGLIYQAAKKIDQALPLFEEALTLKKAVFGAEHPDTALTIGYLAGAYSAAERFAEAEKLFQELLEYQRRTIPAGHSTLSITLAQRGDNLLKANQPAKAEPFLRECLEIRRQTQPDEWTTFNTQSLLGAALLGQQQYGAAEPLLLAGYAGMNEREATIPPQGKIRLIEALQRLIELYVASGRPDKSDEWRATLDAAQRIEPKAEP